MAEYNTSSTARACKVCGKEFTNGKAWGGHIRACYRKKDYMGTLTDTEVNVREEKEKIYADAAVSVGNTNTNLDLMQSLPHGWSTTHKRSARIDYTDFFKSSVNLPETCTSSNTNGGVEEDTYNYKDAKKFYRSNGPHSLEDSDSTYKKRDVDHHLGVIKKSMTNTANIKKNNKLANEKLVGEVFDNFQGHNKKKIVEKSTSDDSATADSKNEDKSIGGHETHTSKYEEDKCNKDVVKVFEGTCMNTQHCWKDSDGNKRIKSKKLADIGKVVEVIGQNSRTYVCQECREVFDNFHSLGGHMAAHKRSREIGSGRIEYVCDLCRRSFSTGQALGGHKSYHRTTQPGGSTQETIYVRGVCQPAASRGLGIDLNVAPVEAEYE